MMDFTENDLRAIERERDLPPDEPVRYVDLPYADARICLGDALDYLTEPDPEGALRAIEEAAARIKEAM
jgi:hypothetical protein